ncbi:MAG: phosphotransferase family protein [Bacillota bacterium]
MKAPVIDLQKRVQALLDTVYGSWNVTGLRPLGSGLENMVFAADSEAFGPIALRVPWTRWLANVNDPSRDCRDTLHQEAAIAAHLTRYGVPVPRVHALHLSDEIDFLVSDLVVGDGSRAEPRAMGRVAAQIHGAPPPDIPLVCMEGKSLAEMLANRIDQRVRYIATRAGRDFGLPPKEALARVLGWPGARRRLLHMDLRPVNFLARNGAVAAIVDWDNALLGDPALDLARSAEAGEVDMQELLAGYGNMAPFAHLPEPVELLYRLDTAAMLAVVFLEETPDPSRAERFVGRTLELVDRLRRAL